MCDSYMRISLTLVASPSGGKASFGLDLSKGIFRVGQASRNGGVVQGETAARLNDGDVVNEGVRLESSR